MAFLEKTLAYNDADLLCVQRGISRQGNNASPLYFCRQTDPVELVLSSNVSRQSCFGRQRESALTCLHNSPFTESRQSGEIPLLAVFGK